MQGKDCLGISLRLLKSMEDNDIIATPRFLATTADPSFWEANGKIVFLGEWCKPPSTRSQWEHLSFEVVPYHWEDQERKYADYLYLASFQARLLEALSARLNQIHRTNNSVRFWTIVVGPWLRMFVELLFDRYSSVCTAKGMYSCLHAVLPEWEVEHWVPKDFMQFLKWLPRDDYNLHLFAEILRGDSSIKQVSKKMPSSHGRPTKPRPNLAGLAKNALTHLTALVPDTLNQTVIFEGSFHVFDQFKLQLALGQLPYFKGPIHWEASGRMDFVERGRRLDFAAQNDFESLLCGLVMKLTPVAYLESFPELMARAGKELPRATRKILTSVGWYSDEIFKIWAASQAEKGAWLIAIQHGGVYGVTRYMSFEDHERGVSDQFVSWGWRDNRDEKVMPLPAPKLLKAKRQLVPKTDGDIVWPIVAMPRYFRRMHSAVDGPYMPDYLAEQARFWSALAEKPRQLMALRLYAQDYGWGIREYMETAAPGLRIEGWNKPFYARMRESRLCIATYNSTTYLETLAANFPTLIFWNPSYNQLREEAIPYFEQLRSCGILHYTAESAARKLNQVYADPQEWWRQPEVEDAKKAFCEQYARTGPGWLKEWKDFCR